MNSKFFFLYEISLDQWCLKWGLDPFIGKCNKCESVIQVNIPFVYKNMKGLGSKCSCGNNFTPFEYTESYTESEDSIFSICHSKKIK